MTRTILYLTTWILWTLFLSQAHAEQGTYRACAGPQCTEFEAEFYSASEINTLRPKQFCFTHLKSYELDRTGQRILKPGYLLPDDCKKRNNMQPGDEWSFVNPSVGNHIGER